MAALRLLRRTTRKQGSGCELPPKRRRRRNKLVVRKKNDNEEDDVEVIELCESSMEDNEDGGTPYGEEYYEHRVYEDDHLEESEFRTFVDFESSVSLANLTVTSFLKDCAMQPKILCHKQFHSLRVFIEEATGFLFAIPPDGPYCLDHEDDTICVDKGDAFLRKLEERLQNCDLINEKVEVPDEHGKKDQQQSYHWATITPVQKKSELGLFIFRWTPLPCTLSFLDIYLTFCQSKHAATVSNLSANEGRITRASLRNYHNDEGEKEEEVKMWKNAKEANEDNGVDEYVMEFVAVLDLTRNMNVEERLKGDLDAKAVRKLENKEEPKYSRELINLLRRNHSMTTPVQLTFRNVAPTTTGQRDSDSTSERSSSSSSMKESVYSDFERNHGVSKARMSYHIRNANNKTSVVISGLPMINEANRSNSTNNSERATSVCSSASTSTASSASLSCLKKKRTRISCDVCHPSTTFATRKTLYRHLVTVHGSKKRMLITCECGTRIRRERLSFHQKFCKKAIMLVNKRT